MYVTKSFGSDVMVVSCNFPKMCAIKEILRECHQNLLSYNNLLFLIVKEKLKYKSTSTIKLMS